MEQCLPVIVKSPLKKRPFRLWVLWLGLLICGLAGWVRAIYAAANWNWLNFSGMTPGPWYLVITGVLWGLVGSIAVVWFLLRKPWSNLVSVSAVLAFALLYWADRILFHAGQSGSDNTLFAVLFTLLIVLYALAAARPWEEIELLRRRRSTPPTEGARRFSSTSDGD